MLDVELEILQNVATRVASTCRMGTSLFLPGAISLLLAMVVWHIFRHPLARIPGPRLAAITNLWHAHYARAGRMYELATTLHKTYGPVVRVGPNEVWFESREAFRAIYSERLLRPPWRIEVLTQVNFRP